MNTPKEPKKYNLRAWITPKLRRLSYQWPPRKEAQRAGRLERGKYLCALCKGVFGPKEISLDHRDPVIDPLKGYIDWNTYLERLFCDQGNYQILCSTCHDNKTAEENQIRKVLTNQRKADRVSKKQKRKRK